MDNNCKFYVITDLHYFSPALFSEGAAYRRAESASQKLLNGSRELIQEAFDIIADDDFSDVVLIPGDVTCDGEEVSHRELRNLLYGLREKGKKVYLITATHDYLRDDAKAKKYNGDGFDIVPSLTREELFDYYKDFGPGDAIEAKPEYLSYVVQLPGNCRLLALNDDRGFDDDMMKWIGEKAAEAKADGQFLIAMTHHPLVPPSPMYELVGKGNMHKSYETRRIQLADMGIKLFLTGHTHTHNINRVVTENGNCMYVVSTGALCGWPAPIRRFEIEGDKISVSTKCIEECMFLDTGGEDLQPYLKNMLTGAVTGILDSAAKDTETLAQKAVSISIKPKLVYKFGYLVRPVFKWLSRVTFAFFIALTGSECHLDEEERAKIKKLKIRDFIVDLAASLFSGKSDYDIDDPQTKVLAAFLRMLDGIASFLHINVKKLLKVSPDIAGLLLPLACKGEYDAFDAVLKMGDLSEYKPLYENLPKSKRAVPIFILAVLGVIILLPLELLWLAFASLINYVKFGRKIKNG